MAFDAHKNLAISAVATAPTPATSGTSLVVTAGHGVRFPAAPFNVTIWPATAPPDPLNAEVARVTARATDTLTITRAQEGSTARLIGVGDLIAQTITAKTLTDLETRAALKDEANSFTASPQQIRVPAPQFVLVDTSATANAQCFDIVNYGQVLMFRALDDTQQAVQAQTLSLHRTGDVSVLGSVYERARAFKMGTRQPWSPTAQTAEGAAIGGSVTGYYTMVGQMVFWSVFALSMTSGAATAHLRFTIPPGRPPMNAGQEQSAIRSSWTGSPADQWAYTEVDTTHIKVFRAAAFPAGSGHIIGQGFYFTSS